MINLSGRIAASSIEQAVEQIPDDVAEWYSIWLAYTEPEGVYEWRGWEKEVDKN
jgi:hypothetical protein